MLEIWEGATDNNKAFGTLLIYLSKALAASVMICWLQNYKRTDRFTKYTRRSSK